MQKKASAADSLSNFTLKTIDVSTDEGKKIAAANQINQFPWLSVYYPANAQVHGLVWEGPLTMTNAKRLIKSPVREEIANKILAGKAAVWLFLKSGHEEKDQAALETLKATLEKASDELAIPNTGLDINGNAVDVIDFVDYDVNFDLIEISRDDLSETMLMAMLLGSESDLIYYDEPMTFPVFGRGRSLYAIIGKGINQKTVYNACRSIIGWCSCEIKDQNPGIDLLISANWSKPVGGKMVKDELPPLTGLSEFITPEPQKVDTVENKIKPIKVEKLVISDSVKQEPILKDMILADLDPEVQKSSNPLFRNLIIAVTLMLVVVVVATFLLKSKAGK